MTQATDASRARRAARSWRDVASGVKQASRDDHVSLLAAGIAFFMVLSTAPALAALVAIYGLFASPEDVTRQVDDLAGAVPEDARELLTDQLNQVVSTSATIGIPSRRARTPICAADSSADRYSVDVECAT